MTGAMPDSRRIVAVTGAHGTGKTTYVMELAARLKREGACGEVGIIQETARRCPYRIIGRNSNRSSEMAQCWIFSAQMQAEQEALRHYPLVLSDRSIVDSIAYSAAQGHHELAFGMVQVARRYAPATYREIVFRSIADHDFLADDGVRNQDRAFRVEIERTLLDLYAELGIAVTRG